MLGPLDALPATPRRIAIAGRTGAAELASRLSRILGLPIVSSGSPSIADPTGHWITDLAQDHEEVVSPRADTLVWLDIRAWARGAREALAVRVERLAAEHPQLQVMRLRSRHEIEQFVVAAAQHRGE